MKKVLLASLSLLLFIIAILTSCEKAHENKTGSVSFTFNNLDNLKSAGEALDFIVVSLSDKNGDVVYEQLKLDLLQFDDNYITKPVYLEPGTYSLDLFFVGYGQQVKFATPLAGSAMAYLVDNPLPFTFNINEDDVTNVVPQVIKVTSENSDAFGYVTFSFDIISTFKINVAGFTYDSSLNNFNLSAFNLAVYGDGVILLDSIMSAKTNTVLIPDGYDQYQLKATYDTNTYTKDFSRMELQSYSCTCDTGIIKFYFEDQNNDIFTLQPGPDDGKDANIYSHQPDRNYGSPLSDNPHDAAYSIIIDSWTRDAGIYIHRSLLSFNLENITDANKISKAYLSLYFDSTTYHWDAAGFGNYGQNEAVIQRITESWEEHIVTWNNQPATTNLNQVFLPQSQSQTQDYLNIDVTLLVKDMIAHPNTSDGFMIKLLNEGSIYHSLVFASSDNFNPSKHPKLTIEY